MTGHHVRMAALLLTRDARALRTLSRPRWLRRGLIVAVFVGAALLLAAHTATAPVTHCADDAPCRPDAAAALVGGLLLAAGAAAAVHPRTAGWLAGAFTAGVVWYDLARPALASPTWLYGLDLGYAGFCFAVAVAARGPRPAGPVLTWLAGVPHGHHPRRAGSRRWRAAGGRPPRCAC